MMVQGNTALTSDHAEGRAGHDPDARKAAVGAVLDAADKRPEDEVYLDDGIFRVSARSIDFRFRDDTGVCNVSLPWTKVRWIRTGIGWDLKILMGRLFWSVLSLVAIGYLLINPAYRGLDEARALLTTLYGPDGEAVQRAEQWGGFDWFLEMAGTWDYWSSFSWALWALVAWLVLSGGLSAWELARHLRRVRHGEGWLQVKTRRGSIPNDLQAGAPERKMLARFHTAPTLCFDTESVGRLVKILSERRLARRPLF